MDLLDILSLQSYNTRLVVVATAVLGLAAGVVGSFLLLRKRSLMGDVLSHATLPGIAIAFALTTALVGGKSLGWLLLGATAAGLLGIGAMLWIRRTTRLRDDAAMGIVLSVFFGFGAALLRMVQDLPAAAGLQGFIYGKTASIVAADLQLIVVVALFCCLLVWLLFKELTLLCFDEAFASTQGWPVLLLDLVLLAAVVAVTVVGLQAVGLILIIAFMIIPPAAARFWTERHDRMLWLSALLGAASGWLGASVSALYARLPAGALIVLCGALLFFLSMIFGRSRGIVPRVLAARRLRRRIGRQHLLRSLYELLEAGAGPNPPNRPIKLAALERHRAWHLRELHRELARARREDHLEPSAPGTVALSESGYGEATRITRNHRLWEQYLIEYADIAPSHVDRDADAVEHILGPELVRELEQNLGTLDPVPASPHAIART